MHGIYIENKRLQPLAKSLIEKQKKRERQKQLTISHDISHFQEIKQPKAPQAKPLQIPHKTFLPAINDAKLQA